MLAATAVILPGTTLGGREIPAASHFPAANTHSTTFPHLLVPRGGESIDDDHGGPPPPGDGSDTSKKKKKRKKRAGKKEETQSTEPSSGTSDRNDTTKLPSDGKTENAEQTSTPESAPQTIPIVEEILREEDYYRILGINKIEAQKNPTMIKKSYRRRALQTHPDKTNGDRRAFDKVAEAYEVLSDDEKRQVYDRYGKKGLHGAGPGHGFPTAEDLFRSFFGGNGAGRGAFPQARRNRTVRYQLEVSLEDLYQGLTRNVAIASPDGRAPAKEVEVNIPRGALSGQSIRLHGAMDFDHDDTPGDLIFSLQQRPHRRFTRKGHDLAVAVTIGLDEAVNGVTRTIRHLDGRSLTIASARQKDNSVRGISNGDVHVLKGRGMPKNSQGTEFGDLYVQYEVKLPNTSAAASRLTAEEREQLGALISKLEGRVQKQSTPSDVNYLKTASVSDFGTASGRPEIPRDEEDDDQYHGDPFGSPFGRGRSSFYFSSSGGPSPFFGMNPEDLFHGGSPAGDENEQCRQM